MLVRTQGRVRRERFADRAAALDALAVAGREQERSGPRSAVDLRYRRFEPVQLVAARVELRGPGALVGGPCAGMDIRGDGSVEAWRGLVHKRLLEPRRGESPYDALRRELEG